ncbi:hypothetical protein HYC85_030732 [Camellia sinensis]|uniref:Uncharacterized protein n=1 Tax=Camellia sinensis TaxID=4442 RepID=A0A7J7G3F5_CAMSI|nr:hypothetical protein HYC85_030732 [Camellia sinensis]
MRFEVCADMVRGCASGASCGETETETERRLVESFRREKESILRRSIGEGERRESGRRSSEDGSCEGGLVDQWIKILRRSCESGSVNCSISESYQKDKVEVDCPSVGYDKKVVEEVNTPANDVVLLKSDPPSLSPNSLRENWVSMESTTSNSSGS